MKNWKIRPLSMQATESYEQNGIKKEYARHNHMLQIIQRNGTLMEYIS